MECLAVASHAMVNVLMIADVRKEEKMDEKAVAVIDKIYKIFREDREKAECLKKYLKSFSMKKQHHFLMMVKFMYYYILFLL